MKTGFYLMAPIVPYCGPVRVPATLKEILPNGRLLLSDDTMRRCGSEYLIETDADCFQPANKPDVALSTGRIVRHTLMANGATNAEIHDSHVESLRVRGFSESITAHQTINRNGTRP